VKRVRVHLDYVYQLPDHVRVEEPFPEATPMLFLHGRYVEPEICWQALAKIEDKDELPEQAEAGWSTEAASDEIHDVLNNAIETVEVAEMDILPPENEEEDTNEAAGNRKE